MRYAVGEIVLVVVGILIALSINTWNEENKARRIEQDMLNEIKLSLVRDLEDLEMNLQIHNQILRSQDILVEWLENDKVFVDSLSYHFARVNHQTEFISNEGAFETLKSIGLRSLSNDSIRIDLLRIYDLRYKMYREFQNYYRSNLDHIIKNVNPKYFEFTEDITVLQTGKGDLELKWNDETQKSKTNKKIIDAKDIGQGSMSPKNVKNIRTDSIYSYWLRTNRNNNDKFIHFGIIPLILDIDALIDIIEDELKLY